MSNPQPSESTIREALASVTDPELGRTLDELRMLPTVEAVDGQIRITVDLPTPAYPQPERITDAIRQALTDRSLDTSGLQVDFMSNVRGKNSGAKIGLQAKNVIAVGSGKGGVGKSTIAASLAYGLQHYGAKVGLMDADVYGPSIPHLVGAQGQPAIKQVPARRWPRHRTNRTDRRRRPQGDLDGIPRPGGSGGHLAWADAPQGVDAVPAAGRLG